MRVLVTLEHRFQRTPDGRIWTGSSHPYSFWTRYLDAFNQVDVLARVLDVKRPNPSWLQADGPDVYFVGLPHFIGPGQCLRNLVQIRRIMQSQASRSNAVILRVPSPVSHFLTEALTRAGHPFGLEVVGDPDDVFAPNSGVKHALRPVFRKLFSATLKQQCRNARGVAYVTRSALQRKYPSNSPMMGISDVILPESAFTTSYSSIELKSKSILSTNRGRVAEGDRAVLVFVGSLEQLYKAPDVLIKAFSKVVGAGFDARLRIIGDGRYRRPLEQLVHSLGVTERCEFLGQLPSGTAVQNVLDASDLFVLPSRVEALPRAMIEAMARGLPCIGSTVGGIPELLEPDYLVAPGDVQALSKKIVEVISNPQRQRAASERNIGEARKYSDDVLCERRIEFYKRVRSFTSDWLSEQKGRNALNFLEPAA